MHARSRLYDSLQHQEQDHDVGNKNKTNWDVETENIRNLGTAIIENTTVERKERGDDIV